MDLRTFGGSTHIRGEQTLRGSSRRVPTFPRVRGAKYQSELKAVTDSSPKPTQPKFTTMNFNSIILGGNLPAAPDLRATAKGTTVQSHWCTSDDS
jgi:hypothetical protein